MKKWSASRSNKYVSDLFAERFSIRLEPIPESTEPGKKTPDFSCGPEDHPDFVCEVKTLNDDWSWCPPDGKIHVRRDNKPAKIGRHISEAAEQMASYDCPKVLVFNNVANTADCGDLDDAFLGERNYYNKDGSLHHIDISSRKVARGEIKDKKKLIDLYVWIENNSKISAPVVFLRAHSTVGIRLAEKFFGVDPSLWEKAPTVEPTA